jgi:uncharacterized protein (DUF1778 family)
MAEADKMGKRVDLRLPADTKARYDRAAKAAGLKFSQWVRTRLDAAYEAEVKRSGRRGNPTRPEKSGPSRGL